MMKNFKGRLDSLYKKWELYLFRLFKLARVVKNQLTFPKISYPPIKEIIDRKGCESDVLWIPPNPFTMREEDIQVFRMFYSFLDEKFSSDNRKALQQLLKEIIRRMVIIKRSVGITANTRFMGEEKSERRLCNEIDLYFEYPEHFSIHRICLGDDKDLLEEFQRFLKDRGVHTLRDLTEKNYL